jgi:hypothetical protein
MPTGNVSNNLQGLANQWQKVYEKTPDVAAKATSEIVKSGIKLVGPGVEIAGGVWAAEKSVENLAKIIGGQDVPGFKASTSNTDAVLGGIVYSVAGMVAAGMTIHGAIRAAAIVADALEKK